MELFEASDGQLINPLLVCLCRTHGMNLLLEFVGGNQIMITMTSSSEAESELLRYKSHFESIG